MAVSHLIIGLGNPGEQYGATRHNIGFMALDAIAERYNCQIWKKKFRGLTATAENLLLLKPQTFMNLSGEAAIEAIQFYQLTPAKVIVFHDDLDLSPGQVRVKQGGGTGGHNGLKSLDTHISSDYWRVRLGIGRPMTEADSEGQREPVKGDAVSNYVLSPFARADKIWLVPLIDALAANFDLLLSGKNADYQARTAKTSV
jgi:PTH1 family peptidyl-tRNA hydrolase